MYFLLLSLKEHIAMLWFNPSQQLSTRQLLAYSSPLLPCGMGRRMRKSKILWIEINKV